MTERKSSDINGTEVLENRLDIVRNRCDASSVRPEGFRHRRVLVRHKLINNKDTELRNSSRCQQHRAWRSQHYEL